MAEVAAELSTFRNLNVFSISGFIAGTLTYCHEQKSGGFWQQSFGTVGRRLADVALCYRRLLLISRVLTVDHVTSAYHWSKPQGSSPPCRRKQQKCSRRVLKSSCQTPWYGQGVKDAVRHPFTSFEHWNRITIPPLSKRFRVTFVLQHWNLYLRSSYTDTSGRPRGDFSSPAVFFSLGGCPSLQHGTRLAPRRSCRR